MNKLCRLALLGVFLGLIVALAGGSLLAESPPLTYNDERVVYFEDFSGYRLNHTLTSADGWDIRNVSGENVLGSVKVVADDGTDSKRALQVLTNQVGGQFNFFSPAWDFQDLGDDDVNAIAFEFKVNWQQGTGMNVYLYGAEGPEGPDKIVLAVDRSLRYSDPIASWQSLGNYTDGWNTVRVIANREKQEAQFYLNNEYVGTGIFRRPVTSWVGSKFRFLVVSSENMPKEILYGDLKAWTISDRTSSDYLDYEPISWEGKLRPSHGSKELVNDHSISIPFYQAIPVSRGVVYPSYPGLSNGGLRLDDGRFIPAITSPASLWPDGSIRWLTVDGVLPHLLSSEQGVPDELSVVFGDSSQENGAHVVAAPPPVHSLDVIDGAVHFLGEKGDSIAVLKPRASYIEITKPKVIPPDSVPDHERQYEWALPLEELTTQTTPKPLTPRIRESVIEEENELYTVYRLRGDGGTDAPGQGLEWQLRVRVYKSTPVVRLHMSWGLLWDPEKYALTQAEWVADFSSPFDQATVPGTNGFVDLELGSVRVSSDPTGRNKVSHNGRSIAEKEFPASDLDVTVVRSQASYMGIAGPNFTRLGPNHIDIDQSSIVIASWSEGSQLGLDLRPTIEAHEFQISESDLNASGAGVTRTLEMALVWGAASETALALAGHEARRDNLWFPSRQDLDESGSLGPMPLHVLEANEGFFEQARASFHFFLASRDYWRWNGWATYGDFRTYFSRNRNPELGLYPDQWALYGRFGWRNGSTEPYVGMWQLAFALEDRDLMLAAVDYALHVADVDVVHGSFFSSPSGPVGAMHRRNKDHWSGSHQMQYTPSSGLYLTKWLTGHERFDDTLEELRGYAFRERGNSGSVYAGSAWIHRYMETHDPEHLTIARRLLDSSASMWERRGIDLTSVNSWGNPDPNAKLTGLEALYQNNFRLPLDGIPSLIEFYEATEDRRYLDAYLTSLKVHGIPDGVDTALSHYHGLAYLLEQGYSEEDIGLDLIEKAHSHVTQLVRRYDGILPPRDRWDYDTLRNIALDGASYVELMRVGWRTRFSTIVMKQFGRPPVQIRFYSPAESSQVSGTVPIDIRLVDPAQASKLKKVTIEVDGQVLFSGSTLPDSEQLMLDTSTLSDGRHYLTVITEHDEFGIHRHRVNFTVSNMWTLIQNMTPPVSQGWFGSIDFLQTSSRSDGWDYDTGNSSQFFGDAERLVRVSNETEYLIWDRPGLKSIAVTAYIRPQVDLKRALQLDVSHSDGIWHSLDYDFRIDGEGTDQTWHRTTIEVELDDSAPWHLVRIMMPECVCEGGIQIGEVVLTGFRDAPSPSETTEAILFHEDFSDDEIDAAPSRWSLTNANGEYGTIKVMYAPELHSGKALRVYVQPHKESKNMSMRGPAWGNLSEDATTIAIEHKVRWVQGERLFSYIADAAGVLRLMWYVRPPGEFVFNAGDGPQEAIPIEGGWNRIRLVANRVENEVYVYLNDMESPVVGPASFHRPIESWLGAYPIFSHWTTNATQHREIHYGDFKVWVIE